MNWQSISFDWNQIRAFLATVEEGSFSAASRVTGQTQPTLGRQIASLEEQLGITLFERIGRSLVLTDAGAQLVDHVRDMADAASRISLAASGQSKGIEGLVRISASDVLAAHGIPKLLSRLAKTAPQISVEVVAANEVSDLQRREADIAVRHIRPTQPDLIARKLTDAKAHLYAAPSYLKTYGTPSRLDDLAGHNLISYGDPKQMLGHLNGYGMNLTVENFRYYSENGMVGWAMVKEGLGLGIMSQSVALETPDVVRVLPDLFEAEFPVWLATHRELQTSARIRLVFDALADVLEELAL